MDAVAKSFGVCKDMQGAGVWVSAESYGMLGVGCLQWRGGMEKDRSFWSSARVKGTTTSNACTFPTSFLSSPLSRQQTLKSFLTLKGKGHWNEVENPVVRMEFWYQCGSRANCYNFTGKTGLASEISEISQINKREADLKWQLHNHRTT